MNKADVERARPILEEYESQAAQRELQSRDVDTTSAAPVEVVCEECGQTTLFPASQRDTLQICPHCGGHVDVGEMDEEDGFWLEQEGTDDT